MASTPVIFSPARRLAARDRARRLQARPDAPRYLHDDMADDIVDRLAFLRHAPRRALVIGDWTGSLASTLKKQSAVVLELDPLGSDAVGAIDEEQPYRDAGFDFIASLGTLDTVNDLPGALIHLRSALVPGGLMIASFPGAGSLVTLRGAMLEADGERPGPRIHPQVDVRAGGQLLQRCGFADPVIDTRTITARFASLDSLVADLRAQGLGNVLARPGPPLGRRALATARGAFARAGSAGRTGEVFEILTLSGWKR